MTHLVGCPRPAWLRALGLGNLPPIIEIDSGSCTLVRVFKHDSWAATGLYLSATGQRVVVKFNRQQPALGLPLCWVGRLLAQRERWFLNQLADCPGFPRDRGLVVCNGRIVPQALARTYIAGHPLGENESVDDHFFPRLRDMLALLHQRQLAYVDLHKRENVIVGNDGQPYLVDFQISVGPLRGWVGNRLLTCLQEADRFHLDKHHARCRPDQFGMTVDEFRRRALPRVLRLHRRLAVPLRAWRRQLLVRLGVRTERGWAHSEQFVEEALRPANVIPLGLYRTDHLEGSGDRQQRAA